jgi:hypothetical protein
MMNKENINIFMKTAFTILIIVHFTNILQGQNCSFSKNSGNYMPLILMISEDGPFSEMNDTIKKTLPLTNASFISINGSFLSPSEITDTVNTILNKEKQIDKNKIYLIIVGSNSFFEKQNQFVNRIFPSKFFIQTEQDSIYGASFETVSIDSMNLKRILAQMYQSHLWENDLASIEHRTVLDTVDYNRSFEVGLGFFQNYPLLIRSDANFPRTISTLELHMAIDFSWKYRLIASFSTNYHKPSESSSSSEDDQILSKNLFTRSIQLSRFFVNSQIIKPYLSAGFSHSRLTVMSTEKSGTYVKMNMQRLTYGSLMASAGFDFYMGPKLLLDFNASYQASLNSFNTVNNFSLFVGLSYKFHKKEKYFFEYLKLK